jgi:hypothetical protein
MFLVEKESGASIGLPLWEIKVVAFVVSLSDDQIDSAVILSS